MDRREVVLIGMTKRNRKSRSLILIGEPRDKAGTEM